MIDEGAGAPEFTLPAVVGDEIESVSLSDYLGRDVVVLAFYPGDFNPACDGQETDLDELDLFTMQKDVSILGVSGDRVFAHQAFADEYDLHVPLLSDVEGEAAAAYGVGVDDPDAGYQTRRAVVVVSPQGEVEYTWSTDDLRELPPVDHVREAVDEVVECGEVVMQRFIGRCRGSGLVSGRLFVGRAGRASESIVYLISIHRAFPLR
jgi:peroxiredoxin